MKVKKKKLAQNDRFNCYQSGDNSHIARPKQGELPLIHGI